MDFFHTRPCIYAADKGSIVDLLIAYRAATTTAVYPTTWRARLLLTSRVWAPEQDICIWETETGRMAAIAFLWRRRINSPYLVLERAILPAFTGAGLAASMLAWGSQRAEEIYAGQSQPLTVYAQDFAYPSSLDSGYAACGFTPMVPNPDDLNVYYGRSLAEGLRSPELADLRPPELADLRPPVLPEGYSIRPVQGLPEMKEYQSMYSFAAVNPEHQQELLDSDEYSHLVVVDPHGKLAGYCESSISRQEWRDCGQCTGWIDYIETRAEQRGKGLGLAVLWAGLEHLRGMGAESAMLVTSSSNAAAARLYEKAGFTPQPNLEPPRYEKRIGL